MNNFLHEKLSYIAAKFKEISKATKNLGADIEDKFNVLCKDFSDADKTFKNILFRIRELINTHETLLFEIEKIESEKEFIESIVGDVIYKVLHDSLKSQILSSSEIMKINEARLLGYLKQKNMPSA